MKDEDYKQTKPLQSGPSAVDTLYGQMFWECYLISYQTK